MNVGAIVLTAVLSAGATAAAMYVLWRRLLMPDLERRARQLADEATATASAELTIAAEALVPQFRQAIRDGIQDAVLTPPTDRLTKTARGVTSAGVTVVETSLRRILGAPAARPAAPSADLPPAGTVPPQPPPTPRRSGQGGDQRR